MSIDLTNLSISELNAILRSIKEGQIAAGYIAAHSAPHDQIPEPEAVVEYTTKVIKEFQALRD